jgi:hypothetical protein
MPSAPTIALPENHLVVDKVGNHEEDAAYAPAEQDRRNDACTFGEAVVKGQDHRIVANCVRGAAPLRELVIVYEAERPLQIGQVGLELGQTKDRIVLQMRQAHIGDHVVTQAQRRLGKHHPPKRRRRVAQDLSGGRMHCRGGERPYFFKSRHWAVSTEMSPLREDSQERPAPRRPRLALTCQTGAESRASCRSALASPSNWG